MEENTIKKCPLCGHEAELKIKYSDEVNRKYPEYVYISCTHCLAKSRNISITDKKDFLRETNSVIILWNNGFINFNYEDISNVLALKSIQKELQEIKKLLALEPAPDNFEISN